MFVSDPCGASDAESEGFSGPRLRVCGEKEDDGSMLLTVHAGILSVSLSEINDVIVASSCVDIVGEEGLLVVKEHGKGHRLRGVPS